MKIGDNVYVIDWGKHYSQITKWVAGKKENIFLIIPTENPRASRA